MIFSIYVLNFSIYLYTNPNENQNGKLKTTPNIEDINKYLDTTYNFKYQNQTDSNIIQYNANYQQIYFDRNKTNFANINTVVNMTKEDLSKNEFKNNFNYKRSPRIPNKTDAYNKIKNLFKFFPFNFTKLCKIQIFSKKDEDLDKEYHGKNINNKTKISDDKNNANDNSGNHHGKKKKKCSIL